MKQTAVEWLYSFMLKPLSQWPDDMWDQAKEMEKEQVIEGYAHGHNDGCRYMTNEKQVFIHAEQYYNETFTTNQK